MTNTNSSLKIVSGVVEPLVGQLSAVIADSSFDRQQQLRLARTRRVLIEAEQALRSALDDAESALRRL